MSGEIPAPAPTAQGMERFSTVCKRVLTADPFYFPQADYRGKTIFFCTETCLGAFLADPDVFYRVHPNSEKAKDHVETG